jgi:hypothetical protein
MAGVNRGWRCGCGQMWLWGHMHQPQLFPVWFAHRPPASQLFTSRIADILVAKTWQLKHFNNQNNKHESTSVSLPHYGSDLLPCCVCMTLPSFNCYPTFSLRRLAAPRSNAPASSIQHSSPSRSNRLVSYIALSVQSPPSPTARPPLAIRHATYARHHAYSSTLVFTADR